MKAVNSIVRRLLIAVCLIAVAWIVVDNYSFIFAKDVVGEVLENERVSQPSAIITGNNVPNGQLVSFAVLVRSFDGKIFSSSTEDRRWAVAKKGYCVKARFLPYPPWNMEKGGTYWDARVVDVLDCKVVAPPGWTPGVGVTGSPSADAIPAAAATPPSVLPTPAP